MSFVVEKKGEKKMPFLDTDRLYENIEEKYKFAQGEARKAYSDVLDTICEMPSADVEEIRHGRWVSNKLDGYKLAYYCSECGWIDGYPFNDRHKYCPNCGTLMDGE